MSAAVYTIPADARSSGESTAVLSVPTYVDEVPTMFTNDASVPVPDTLLEPIVHQSDDQPVAHVAEARVESHADHTSADARPEPVASDDQPVFAPVAPDGAFVPAGDAEQYPTTPAALPVMLAETVANQTRAERRRNKQNRPNRDTAEAFAPGATASASAEANATSVAPEEVVDSSLPVDQTTPLSPVDDPNNPDWKSYWPSNELVIYAVLDPSTAQAPTVDGIRLIRTQAQITEIDPETSDIGIVAKVPVQILPMARGYEPLYNEITRARRTKQRVRPFMVEMRGVCKRLADQDSRFATTRRTTLFGMQISTVKRIDKNQMQFGRWRGSGTVSAVRPFELDGVDYYRVTLEVATTKKKVFLRGVSAQVDPVDVLIRKDHKHVQRFRRVGQRLLVEAEITAQTSIMRDTHPALEGLDDETRQRLATIRQGIVLANMGAFPDAQAERDFANWQRSGVGNTGRPGRGRREDGTGTGRNGNTAPRPARQQNHRQDQRQQRPAEQKEQVEVVA